MIIHNAAFFSVPRNIITSNSNGNIQYLHRLKVVCRVHCLAGWPKGLCNNLLSNVLTDCNELATLDQHQVKTFLQHFSQSEVSDCRYGLLAEVFFLLQPYCYLVQHFRMHIMAGRTSRYDHGEMETTFLENLKYAADKLQKVSSVLQ